MCTLGNIQFESKEEAYRWLFANKDGEEVEFTNVAIAQRVFDYGVDFDGVVTIGAAKAKVKLCHDAETGEVEVRFPHIELGKIVPLWETVGVGWIVRDNEGKCWFRTKSGA